MVVVHPPTSAPSLSVPSTNHDGSYTVSWGAVSRASSYTLQERKNSGSWSTAYSGGNHSKARSGRTDGSYGYRARGCNVSGCGSWSATHTVSVTIIPAVPSAHINTTGTYKRIYQDLAWDAISSASHYEVKTGSNGTVLNVGTATSYRLRTYLIEDSPPPVTGYVRACNSNGCSAWDSAVANAW